MKLPSGAAAWAGALALLGAFALAISSLVSVRTGMEDFVEDTAASERLGVLGRLLGSRRARTMAFVLGAPEPEIHRAAALALRQRLAASGHFAWVRGGSEPGDNEAFYQHYFPHRFGLTELPAEDGALAPWLTARIAAAKQALAGPMGALMARVITQDPILAFPDIVRRLEQGAGSVRDRGGQLETADGKWSVVFAQARAPALAGGQQGPLIEHCERVIAELRAGGKLEVLWTGVNRFAVETERRIRGELGYIGLFSTLPVLILYLLVFRSLRQFLAGLVVIGLGLGAAVLVCQLLFGSVHGLALTFGAALIGVTIDYAAHYSVHLAHSAAGERPAMLRMLLRATSTGVVTTVAAFAAVGGGQLRVLEQIAVLGVTGALVAFASTHLLLPRFIPPTPRAPASARDGLLAGLDRHARGVMAASAVLLLLAAAGLLRWRWRDDVDAFKTPLPSLEAETARVQEILGQDGQAPTIVVTGADEQAALRSVHQVSARLDELIGKQVLAGYGSVLPVVSAAERQRARYLRLAGAELEAPYRAALAAAGFKPEAFPPWRELVRAPATPLVPDALARSLPFLLDAWRIEAASPGARAGFVVAPSGVRDEPALTAALEALPGVFVIRPQSLLAETYALFRARIVRWLALGVLLVVAIIVLVYRRVRFVLSGLLPALLGATATLGLLAWLGIPGNVLHVVGLVLVLGLGVDYGVYLVEAREGSLGLSIRGILLGAATTCVSFGALAFSSNAAVHTLGLTSAIGIVLTTATCPLVIFLVQGVGRRRAT